MWGLGLPVMVDQMETETERGFIGTQEARSGSRARFGV